MTDKNKVKTKVIKQGDYNPVDVAVHYYGVELRQKMASGSIEQVFFTRSAFNRMLKWYAAVLAQKEKG